MVFFLVKFSLKVLVKFDLFLFVDFWKFVEFWVFLMIKKFVFCILNCFIELINIVYFLC